MATDRKLRLLGTVAAVLILSAAVAGNAAAARPDLVVSSISAKGSLKPGATVTATVTTRNIGSARARKSTTKLYASRDRFRGADDLLLGRTSVTALAPGASVTKKIVATVPAGNKNGELLACADAAKVVTEANERNNCRSAADADLDGWANFTDCAPRNALVNPGAEDAPNVPGFTDTNCDGIDGDASQAIFVSPAGADTNPGTRAQPKRTLASSVAAASAAGKDVYARVGVYDETLSVANGVDVYGGYGTSWARTRTEATRIVGPPSPYGDTQAAIALNISVATTLQLLALEPAAPTTPGADSYGLRGSGSPGLRLEHMTVRAAAGVRGLNGSSGATGRPGGNGPTGATGGGTASTGGGTSPVGRVGGNGGAGGYWLGYPRKQGYPGGPGQSTTYDAWGLIGGAGGAGGAADTVGGRGWNGDSGRFLGNGSGGGASNLTPTLGVWTTADGTSGGRGTNGHGGGGGGGGGSEDCFICYDPDQGGHGGGGGGGGEGGGAGLKGHGGGGSFGIFLYASAGAIVRDSTVVAAAGGAGGAGGAGAWGGAGGLGGAGGAPEHSDAGPGGAGGHGGAGGRGGDGGGGAGGPSIAIVGLDSAATPGTSVSHANGGAGGAGGYGSGGGAPAGAAGVAAAYL